MSARRLVTLYAAALAVAAFLNAQGLRHRAETQPAGFARNAALVLTAPLVAISHALYLDRPRRELQLAIGRANVDRINTNVRLLAPVQQQTHRPRAPGKRRPIRHRQRIVRGPVFTPRHPLRVWVGGDSLAEIPGQALERAAPERGPVDIIAVESRVSTGLTRPDLYNWFNRIIQVMDNLRPNVVIFSFGADDAHDYMSGLTPGTRIGNLGSPSWDAEYSRRVLGVMRELNAHGTYVVWLGLPIPRGPGFHHSFLVVNGVLRRAVASAPKHAAYIDTWSLLSTKNGRYADYLPERGRLVLMRASDGVHVTPAAGDLIAHQILRKLSEMYELRISAA
jgi:hypothetical protein